MGKKETERAKEKTDVIGGAEGEDKYKALTEKR